MFHRYGFETVRCEELSFYEQISIFSKAEIIAGPHGAGLANMIVAPKDARVLELSAAGVSANHYWCLASALGLGFWYLKGEPIRNPGSGEPDIRIGLSELGASLEAMSSKN
jgi:capsular polysaccharide biosynthesis protein